MEKEQRVLEILTALKIEYVRVEHPPVYTVEEAKKLCPTIEGGCKNLFLKGPRGENYYLVIMIDTKIADMKAIGAQLEVSRLSFAKEEELYHLLGLKPGEVAPFGLLNNENKAVTVVIDDELEMLEQVSFHPNVNTSTLVMTYKDLMRYLEWQGNKVKKIKI